MTLQVRQSAVSSFLQTIGGVVPFVPAARSTLCMVVYTRGGGVLFGAANTPAGWTLVETIFGGDNGDAVGVFLAPAAVTTVPACTNVGNDGCSHIFLELEDVNRAAVAVGHTVNNAFSANTVAGPATTPPAAVGGPVLALALLEGTRGDPAPGCYWNNLVPWTKEQCSTNNGAAEHPWWAVYSQVIASAPGTITDTFVNTVGQQTLGAILILPKASSGGAFSGEPGGGVW